MDALISDLAWLVDPPSEFRDQARQIAVSSPETRTKLQRLAEYRLSGAQLYTLGSAIGRLAAEDSEAVRIGVLSNSTSDLLIPSLAASTLRHGVWAHVIGTPFDQAALEALNPASPVNQAKCHFILLALDHSKHQKTKDKP
jgi:hypothetical protein